MLTEVRTVPPVLFGSPSPRVGPPRPLRSDIDGFRREAECLGIELFPWQDLVGWYLNALDANDRHLYPEVADVVSRQNGKTEILVPHICDRLLKGRRILHTAQNRELPREVFGRVADHMFAKHWAQMARKPRFANGQEEIRLKDGGDYRIIAPTRSGARGHHADDLIADEVRDYQDTEFVAAAKPSLNASPNPQALWVSNAGDETSVVLNALRVRSGQDPALAYLEWSAAPERQADDVEGWLESNPSAGHMPQIIGNLEREYRANKLGGTLAIFETEHLCRWVISMRERLVDEYAWSLGQVETLGDPKRPFLAVSMDPKGRRASAALAWQLPDDAVAVEILLEATGDPIDTAALGRDLKALALKYHAREAGGDPLTDGELAKFLAPLKWNAITGRVFANASSRFALAVQSRKLVHSGAASLTDDLGWTTRKQHDESGSYQAVRADDDRPITASLAAIRAVWLASGPSTLGGARIW